MNKASSFEIVPAPPRALVLTKDEDEARAQLELARARLVARLDKVQRTLKPFTHWTELVKRYPWRTVGGAFVVGFALSKLFSRK